MSSEPIPGKRLKGPWYAHQDAPCGPDCYEDIPAKLDPVGIERGKSTALQAWADASMYRAEPMPMGGKLTVKLLQATEDPLGVVAALCGMYEGRVTRNLSEVTDDQRVQALADMQSTALNGPLSAVQFVFLVEGADRSLTHQAVRQQAAFFAQESLRFAVKEDWADDIPLPPHLAGLRDDDPKVRIWRKALVGLEDSYAALVHAGMPAEEARGLLPEAILTRYYWVTNLKGLFIEAGKRTCTQAQFHWRRLFAEVARSLRDYGHEQRSYWYTTPEGGHGHGPVGWQFDAIADALRPNCYQTGSCGFMAKFDRGCTIRERVNQNERAGRPSSEWHLPEEVTRCSADSDCPGGCAMEEHVVLIEAIDPREWAADPGAART